MVYFISNILCSLIRVNILLLFNRILKATLSCWRLRVEAEIPKNKRSQIYSPEKDCKFWAGLRQKKKIAVFQVILENKIGSIGRQKVFFLSFFSN